jgi:hypothetical protein
MAKRLSLADLKVQSFVTTLDEDQADQMVGCGTKTQVCGCTQASNCCDTSGNCTQLDCTGTDDTGDFCCLGTELNCTYDFSYCNC